MCILAFYRSPKGPADGGQEAAGGHVRALPPERASAVRSPQVRRSVARAAHNVPQSGRLHSGALMSLARRICSEGEAAGRARPPFGRLRVGRASAVELCTRAPVRCPPLSPARLSECGPAASVCLCHFPGSPLVLLAVFGLVFVPCSCQSQSGATDRRLVGQGKGRRGGAQMMSWCN